jgi:hypothetical protein
MTLSAFDLFSIGIGPSSSHTVGPMRAAKRFVDDLVATGTLGDVRRVRAQLFGSLGATGRGHGSPKAVILGLEGEDPAEVDTDTVDARVARNNARRGDHACRHAQGRVQFQDRFGAATDASHCLRIPTE